MRITLQEIHCKIQVIPSTVEWLVLTIYPNNNYVDRQWLWSNLENVTDSHKGPWILGGNFNKALFNTEKFGGNNPNKRRSSRFLDCLNYWKMIDLGI